MIKITTEKLMNTPFRKWDTQLIEDAKKYLSPGLVNKIISYHNDKKMK